MVGIMNTEEALRRDAIQHILLVLGFGLNRAATLLGSYAAFGLVLGNFGFVTSLEFMFAKGLAGAIVAFVVVALVAKRKILCARLPILLPTVCFSLLFLLGVFAPEPLAMNTFFRFALGVGCGALATIFSLAWFEILLRGPFVKDMVGGCFVSAIVVFAIQQLPLYTVFAVSVFGIFASCGCLRYLRQVVSVDVSLTQSQQSRPLRLKTLLSADYVQAILCILVSVFVVGAMHTAVFDSESMGIIVGIDMGLVAVVSCIIVAVFIFFAAGVPNPLLVYKLCLPIMLALFSLMPFTSSFLGSTAGFVMNVCYSVIAMAFMAFLMEYGWKTSQLDCSLYGLYLGGSNLVLIVGLVVGQFLNALSAAQGVSIFMLLAFVGIYPLGIVLIIILTKFRVRAKNEQSGGFDKPEDVSPSHGAVPDKPVQPEILNAGEELEEDPILLDGFAVTFGLTNREQDVCAFLVKGRAIKYIANTLYLSDNTVWSHAKGVYSKTGVHSKEELIQLYEKMELETE